MDGSWTNSMTWKNRYDDFGVTGYMLLHSKGMKDVVAIDVGCSTGIAVAESKKCMAKHGVRLHAIGIDMSGNAKLAAEAESNLDEFVNENALEVDGYAGRADIVVCLNVVRFVRGDVKSRIVEKCAEFLKPDGVFITGVGKNHREILELEEPISSHPKNVCAGLGWRSLVTMLGDTRMMKRAEALRYAGIMQSEWENMGRFHKRMALAKYRILASVWR